MSKQELVSEAAAQEVAVPDTNFGNDLLWEELQEPEIVNPFAGNAYSKDTCLVPCNEDCSSCSMIEVV